VVLEDEVVDAAGQAVFTCQLDTVQHVLGDGGRTFSGIKVLVGVDIGMRLVLDKEAGVHGLAHIVEEGAHAGQQGVCADALGGLLGQISDLQAMLVGAWRVTQEKLQQREVRARDFEQLQRRGQPQDLGKEVLQQQRDAS
jgi:hypothetical protein